MKFCLYVLIALFSSSIVFGQSVTLRGLITDESGAIVPGATIVVTNGSGSTTNTVSANDGSYSAALPPGDYSVQASAPSLKSAAVKVSIRSGVQSLDLQMKVATVGQEVTVEDRAVAVTPEPANNAGATVLGQDELQALSDNPEDLIAELMAIAGPSAGLGGASLFIDGFADGQVPSKEAIREIHINQNPFSPEYDKIGTGRIEILTKPGTNQFHGTEGFNISNDVWNSRNPYGQQKAPFFLKEYIGNVSGPIGNRASFFVDLRRDAIDNGAIINGSTIDPSTLNIIDPFTEVFLIAQRRWTINPRADFQHFECAVECDAYHYSFVRSRRVQSHFARREFHVHESHRTGDRYHRIIRKHRERGPASDLSPALRNLSNFDGLRAPGAGGI
jgi:hypothetical protein